MSLIVECVAVWREKHGIQQPAPRKPPKNLADFLLESPLHGSELEIERQKDYPRGIDIG